MADAEHMITAKVPAGFWNDHKDRSPDNGPGVGIASEIRASGRSVVIQGTPAQIDGLLSDAVYYANQDNHDADRWLTESARRTVAALHKVLGC